jgi:hypothetical protein
VDEVSAAMSEVEAELELEVRAKTAAPREHES